MEQVFALRPLNPDEGKDVFYQGLGEVSVSDPNHADDLVRELHYIPLAIRQATAYIRSEEEHSALKYLDKLKQSKERVIELLGYESHESYGEDNDPAVLTALYLSFTSLHHNETSLASRLLSCISFLDNKSIPYSLLNELYDRIKRNLPDVNPRGLDKELKFLEDHNLVERDTKTNCYGMLQIIQLSMNAWVKKNLRDRIASDVCIDALIACWPTRNDSKDDAAQSKQLLLPHIHAIADCEAHFKEQRKDWATLLHNAGSYAFSNYMGFFARKLLEKSMETREKTLGRNHPTTLETALGYFRTAAGMKEDKETLIFGEELQGRLINELGADHVHTLICQRYLAPLYSLFGQPDKAEMVITQAYEAGCRILKEDDKERLLLSCGLAEIYQGKCQHEKARDLYAEAYELQKQRDPSDPSLLAYKCRLGAAHQAMGDYETAKQILEEHLIETEERYGENSSAAAQSKVTLAELFKDTKQFQAAEPLYQEAVRLFERERGATHTDTMHMSMNLAEVYEALGRANEAEKIWDQMREILEEATERSCEGMTETMEQKLKKPTSLAPSMKMTIMTHGLIKQYENGNREQRTQAAEDMEGLVRYSKSIFGTEHGETQALLNTLMFMYLHLYQHQKFWDTRSQLIRPPPRPGMLPCPCVVL